LTEIRQLQSSANIEVKQESEDFHAISQITWPDWEIDIPGRAKSYLPGNTVNSGEIFFIIGDSGIGKSSFALNLIGADFSANLRVGSNQTLVTPELRSAWQSEIGWVPQLPQLAPGSIRRQFQLVKSNISDAEILNYLASVHLRAADLPQGLDSIIGGLAEGSNSASGGQVRKVALARALASKPRVLVCDEPMADLDAESADRVLSALRTCAQSGSVVICITHDLSIIGPTDRVASFRTASSK
jgi:ATP-binding cassette subfamily C protein CydD